MLGALKIGPSIGRSAGIKQYLEIRSNRRMVEMIDVPGESTLACGRYIDGFYSGQNRKMFAGLAEPRVSVGFMGCA